MSKYAKKPRVGERVDLPSLGGPVEVLYVYRGGVELDVKDCHGGVHHATRMPGGAWLMV